MTERAMVRPGESTPGRRMGDWLDWLAWPGFGTPGEGTMLRIEEVREGDTFVIKAEMPGIDPDKDVQLDVHEHVLEFRAERREETTSEDNGSKRTEFRYGQFFRAVPLPTDAKEDSVTAAYHDGILEVRVPCTSEPKAKSRHIHIKRK